MELLNNLALGFSVAQRLTNRGQMRLERLHLLFAYAEVATQCFQAMLALDDDTTVRHERTERRAAVERAVDVVRERFGLRAVGPATLVEPDRRVGE